MCGRFSQNLSRGGRAIFLFKNLSIADRQASFRYNVAPTQLVAAAVQLAGKAPEARDLHWGLIPSWAKDKTMAARLINARAETVAEKPSFRTAFKSRRCLVPADGFYEWRREGKAKTPFYFSAADNTSPLVFAGLWEHWSHPDEEIESFTIITAEANSLMSPIHDRMPVILPEATWTQWLDPQNRDADQLLSLLRPAADDMLQCWQVSDYVNSPRHEGEKCIEKVA